MRSRRGRHPGRRSRRGVSRGRQPGVVLGVPGSGRTGCQWPSLHRAPGSGPYTALQSTPDARAPRIPEPSAARDTRPVTMAAETRRGETGAMGAPGSQPGPGGDRPRRVTRDRARARGGGRERPLAGPGRRRARHRRITREAAHRMLRLLHTADVHLGARHADLGDAARPSASASSPPSPPAWTSRSRRRSTCSSSRATCSTPTSSPADRWSASPRELAPARRRRASAPSSSRAPTTSTTAPSVYRAYDLAAMAGAPPGDDLVTVLTPEQPWIHLHALDAVVHGPVFPTKRAPHSPLRDLPRRGARRRPGDRRCSTPRSRSRAGPTSDEVVITDRRDRRQRARLPRARPLARRPGRAGPAASRTPTRARPSPSRSTRTTPARCCSSRLTTRAAASTRRGRGADGRAHDVRADRARRRHRGVAARPGRAAQGAANPDLVLDVRLIGVRPDELDLDAARGRGRAPGRLPPRPRPRRQPARRSPRARCRRRRRSPGRSSATSRAGSPPSRPRRHAAPARRTELRDALRLGRLLLAGQEVTL